MTVHNRRRYHKYYEQKERERILCLRLCTLQGSKLVGITLQEMANPTALRTVLELAREAEDDGMAREDWINRGRPVDLEDHQLVEDLTGAHLEDRI